MSKLQTQTTFFNKPSRVGVRKATAQNHNQTWSVTKEMLAEERKGISKAQKIWQYCVHEWYRLLHSDTLTLHMCVLKCEQVHTVKHITKTRLYNFDPLKPHFYIVKLGFTGYTLFFLFLLKDIDSGYSLEPPLRGGSNEYPQSMF